MKFQFIFFGVVCFISTALALPNSDKYKIEINEKIPNVEKLQKDLRMKNSEYNRHFSFRWDMPEEFDTSFKNLYQTLSNDERHLTNLTEDKIFKMVKDMPKELYPYIGPYLHTLPQLSGRVLDIPGIKETKNQFPQQIANEFKNIENIEYASPYMYIFIIPADLLNSLDRREYPEFDIPEYRPLQKQDFNPMFIQRLVNDTPLSDYASGKNHQKSEGIRHYIADETTPLSGADVKAFSNTLSDLQNFNNANNLQFIKTNFVISAWEEKNGADKGFYFYKQTANPCHSIVRNIKWNNKALEFQNLIGKNGFGLNDWALTCEKTLKAYRRATISEATAIMLHGIKNNQYWQFYKISGLSDEELEILENILGATSEMYNASKDDVKAVKPYMNKIYKELPKNDSYFLGAPLILP